MAEKRDSIKRDAIATKTGLTAGKKPYDCNAAGVIAKGRK